MMYMKLIRFIVRIEKVIGALLEIGILTFR